MKLFFRSLLSLLTAAMLLTLLPACGSPEETPAPANPDAENQSPLLADYTLVYPESVVGKLFNAINAFLGELGEQGIVLSTATEAETEGKGKLLIIGNTNLEVSKAAQTKLAKDAENSYVIDVTDTAIAIVGSNTDATLAGMKYFLMHYISESRMVGTVGEAYVGEFGDELRIFSDLTQWTLEETVIVDKAPDDNPGATLKYPSIIELQHQPGGVNNGMLYATGERWIDDHMCPIYCSADGGSTWVELGEVKDKTHRGVRTAFAPCLYELPVQVGEMPAGTLILGANSIDNAWRNIYVVLYRSYDLGLTWEPFATVGASEGTGGFWEANFACTDDGTLICYFSDDTDPFHSQKLVLRYTKDGENWSDFVETVALENGGLRPGMPVVTKMGNGKYFMAYEIVGMSGNPVYYKITDDPTDWGDPADVGKMIRDGKKSLAATPWCTWIPAGGECGTLIVTGWRMASGKSNTGSDIFLSFDYGKTWTTMDNYYSYEWYSDSDTWGYSASLFFSQDGKTLYYLANPKGDIERSTCYTLFKIKVE